MDLCWLRWYHLTTSSSLWKSSAVAEKTNYTDLYLNVQILYLWLRNSFKKCLSWSYIYIYIFLLNLYKFFGSFLSVYPVDFCTCCVAMTTLIAEYIYFHSLYRKQFCRECLLLLSCSFSKQMENGVTLLSCPHKNPRMDSFKKKTHFRFTLRINNIFLTKIRTKND